MSQFIHTLILMMTEKYIDLFSNRHPPLLFPFQLNRIRFILQTNSFVLRTQKKYNRQELNRYVLKVKVINNFGSNHALNNLLHVSLYEQWRHFHYYITRQVKTGITIVYYYEEISRDISAIIKAICRRRYDFILSFTLFSYSSSHFW